MRGQICKPIDKFLAAKTALAEIAQSEEELRSAVALPGCRGNICVSSKARTASGLPPPAHSTAGQDGEGPRVPRPLHGQRAFRGGDVRAAGGLRMAEEGLDEAAAVAAVIRDNLFGLEIDPRCTQIGAFNLALAAWRRVGTASCRR